MKKHSADSMPRLATPSGESTNDGNSSKLRMEKSLTIGSCHRYDGGRCWCGEEAHIGKFGDSVLESIPYGLYQGANRYATDNTEVLTVWGDGKTFDIVVGK